MDRSLAGRGAFGRIDRSRAPALAPRARSPRRRARSAGARRAQLAAGLRARVALPLTLLRAFWRRRRLRIATLALAALAVLLPGGWAWLRHSSLSAVRHVRISGVRGPDA